MEEPAQGWDHVEKRVRDIAYNMLEVELDVSLALVEASEALLLAQYGGDSELMYAARIERNEDDAHCIERSSQKKSSAVVPRYIPHPPVLVPEAEVLEELGAVEYNPYEAYKAYVEFGFQGGAGLLRLCLVKSNRTLDSYL
jgi:hypothetical protein